MPHYKLTYFPIRGKAEAIRMVFSIAGVEFEDVRVTQREWYTNLKHTGISPFGQMPFLQYDDQILAESKAILTYVAKEFNLAPESSYQQAQADMLSHVISDLKSLLTRGFFQKDPAEKEKALETADKEIIPKKCACFEKFLLANSKQGFFIGDKLTYADIVVFTFLNSYYLKGNAEGIPEQLKEYPALYAWYELVRTQPKVQEWLKNSPPDQIGYVY